jgi:hypothetical protein
MQHQTINIDQPAATRAFDLGDGFGQLWMITFFDERDSCHELPRINQLVQAVQAVQIVQAVGSSHVSGLGGFN